MDDYSRYSACKPLQKKSDARAALIEIINIMEAATNLQVSQVQAN